VFRSFFGVMNSYVSGQGPAFPMQPALEQAAESHLAARA